MTAMIARTTTTTVATAVTTPMTTLKRIQAAMRRTISATARMPSDEPEVDMRQAYLTRERARAGEAATTGRGSAGASARMREVIGRGRRAGVDRHPRQPVTADDRVLRRS